MITSWKMCLALYDNLLTKTKADLIDFFAVSGGQLSDLSQFKNIFL